MKHRYKVLRVIFALSFLVSLMSCKEKLNEPIQYDPNALRVAGNYIATTFILPGDDDGPVDVLANGGSITVELTINYTTTGRIVIPKHPRLYGDGTDKTFKGTYTLKNDSLQFKDMYNVLSNPQLYFIVKEKKLEGQLLSISPMIISLEKIN